jgi:GntR family transcriptional regulator
MNPIAKTYERSRIPRYLQVASTLRRRIQSGHWEPGGKISTLEELEAEFKVARVTVRQAVDLLQSEGLLQCRQGKGTFVAQDIKDTRWLRLAVEWSSLIAMIKENAPRFISVKNPPPFPRLKSGEERLAPRYRYLRSVQSRRNEPYAVVSVHIAQQLYDRDPNAFESQAALAVLSSFEDIKIARAHQTLVIGEADMETADYLKVRLNSPTVEAHCVVIDDQGLAVYVGDIIYRGDFIKLDIDLLRTASDNK